MENKSHPSARILNVQVGLPAGHTGKSRPNGWNIIVKTRTRSGILWLSEATVAPQLQGGN
jgi:hypothetical protein